MALPEEAINKNRDINNFVHGEWVRSSGPMRDVTNPATGKTIAQVPISTGEEMDQAIAAAKAAFPSWRATPVVT